MVTPPQEMPQSTNQKTTVEVNTTNETFNRVPLQCQEPAPQAVGQEDETFRHQALIPQALKNLQTYNKPGLREGPSRPEGRRS